MLLVSPCIF